MIFIWYFTEWLIDLYHVIQVLFSHQKPIKITDWWVEFFICKSCTDFPFSRYYFLLFKFLSVQSKLADQTRTNDTLCPQYREILVIPNFTRISDKIIIYFSPLKKISIYWYKLNFHYKPVICHCYKLWWGLSVVIWVFMKINCL